MDGNVVGGATLAIRARPRTVPPLAAFVAFGLVALLAAGLVSSTRRTPAASASPRTSSPAAGFVPNTGQIASRDALYTAQGAGYRFSFGRRQMLLSFAKHDRAATLALRFVDASPAARLEARTRLTGKVNYFLGRDPARWRTGLPVFGELVYRSVWPGIDVHVRGAPGRLKYEFHVRPGSDPNAIALSYRGTRGLSLTHGALAVATPLGVIRDAAPRSYQHVGGKRVDIRSSYELRGKSGYGFAVEHYDVRRPLVIDPGLEYSTYLGGSDGDDTSGIAVDAGFAYVSGCTFSADFPTTPGAFQTTHDPGGEEPFDVFVSKISRDGSGLVYSTFIGGSDIDCVGNGIAVEGGRAYITGATFSSDFPTTPGAFDRTYAGGDGDGFVTELSRDGSSLAYSTYLGGATGSAAAEQGVGIAVQGGDAFVTGITDSTDFPTTWGAFQRSNAGGDLDVFVTKLARDGSALKYSTYLGGTDVEESEAIAVEGGRAYVTGFTSSTDFPTSAGAFQTANAGGNDAFVTMLALDGSSIGYSTYLGGTLGEDGHGIALEGGDAYVTGATRSTDFPTTPKAFQRAYAGGRTDAFVTKLDREGSALVYSTYLGGATPPEEDPFFGGLDVGNAVAVRGGRAHVTGWTRSTDFPLTPGAVQQAYGGGFIDGFVTTLNQDGSQLGYSTFLGGSDGDLGKGIAVEGNHTYVTGATSSADFPTTSRAFQRSYGGGFSDAFVAELNR